MRDSIGVSAGLSANLRNNTNKTDARPCSPMQFTLDGSCYSKCPDAYNADLNSMTCKGNTSEANYIMKDSWSKCVNSCNKTFFDCSCKADCRQYGNCCSDYSKCTNKNTAKPSNGGISNCSIYDRDSQCFQCDYGYYLAYHNKPKDTACVTDCSPEQEKANPRKKSYKNATLYQDNNLCFLQDFNCTISRCLQCSDTDTCSRCNFGYFLYENECMESCPKGYIADRSSFRCLEIEKQGKIKKESQYNFYSVPSSKSCKSTCEEEYVTSFSSDCSCHFTCMRRGICCRDFLDFCLEEIPKEVCASCKVCDSKTGRCSKCSDDSMLTDKGICICEKDFVYSHKRDKCVLKDLDQMKSAFIGKIFTRYKGSEKKADAEISPRSNTGSKFLNTRKIGMDGIHNVNYHSYVA